MSPLGSCGCFAATRVGFSAGFGLTVGFVGVVFAACAGLAGGVFGLAGLVFAATFVGS